MVDLHCHSCHSDGLWSPEEMATRAFNSGVRVWSLTDHDTSRGWYEAKQACDKLGMRFIPGVEITCEVEMNSETHNPTSWHLLAYFPDGASVEFTEWLESLKEARVPRMKSMLAALESLGHSISIEDVEKHAEGSLGRPHLAEIMVDLGYVEDKNEAFEKWIGDGMQAHVSQVKPTIEEAVNLVKSLGGFTSLAHPAYYGVPVDILAAYCRQIGVDGIEAFHRSHPDFYRFQIWEECK